MVKGSANLLPASIDLFEDGQKFEPLTLIFDHEFVNWQPDTPCLDVGFDGGILVNGSWKSKINIMLKPLTSHWPTLRDFPDQTSTWHGRGGRGLLIQGNTLTTPNTICVVSLLLWTIMSHQGRP